MIIYLIGTILITSFMNGCASSPFVQVDSAAVPAAIQVNKINSTANNEDEDRSQEKLRRKNAIRRNNKSDYETTSEDKLSN